MAVNKQNLEKIQESLNTILAGQAETKTELAHYKSLCSLVEFRGGPNAVIVLGLRGGLKPP